MRPNGVQVVLLLGQLSEEWLREKDAETTVRSQGGSAEIHRGRCEPQVGVWSDGGRRLRHLPNSALPHYSWSVHGHRWHAQEPPSVLRAQVGER